MGSRKTRALRHQLQREKKKTTKEVETTSDVQLEESLAPEENNDNRTEPKTATAAEAVQSSSKEPRNMYLQTSSHSSGEGTGFPINLHRMFDPLAYDIASGYDGEDRGEPELGIPRMTVAEECSSRPACRQSTMFPRYVLSSLCQPSQRWGIVIIYL